MSEPINDPFNLTKNSRESQRKQLWQLWQGMSSAMVTLGAILQNAEDISIAQNPVDMPDILIQWLEDADKMVEALESLKLITWQYLMETTVPDKGDI